MSEYLSRGSEEYRQKAIDAIRSAIEDGRFSQLPPRWQFILAVRYPGERTSPTFGEIGRMFNPSITGSRVIEIETKALERLGVNSPYDRFPVGTLGLSHRAMNALIRGELGNLPLDELAQLSDEEFLRLRNFGRKSLQEFREKMIQLQNS